MNAFEIELTTLSKNDLHLGLKQKVGNEREILSEIVSYITEVDRRKLYLDFGYPSLLEYLMKEMNYSFGSAQRRIDAARLARSCEDVPEKLKTGELSLNQVSIVAQGLRQAKKEQAFTATAAVKQELIEKVQTLSRYDAQKVVAQTLNLEIKTVEKKVVQRDESMRVEITFTKEEAAEIQELKDLLSHTNPNASIKEVLMVAVENLRKQKSPVEKQKRIEIRREKMKQGLNSATKVTAAVAVKPKAETQFTPAAEVRRQVFLKDRSCQWKRTDGKICESKFQLQLDHKHSKWLGGRDEATNLQVLCSAHNRLKYEQEVGFY